MSILGKRNVANLVSGDIIVQDYAQSENASSPAKVDTFALNGTTTMTPPTGAIGFTLLPPATNVHPITLKGTTGEAGIVLHPTDPTSLGLNSTTNFAIYSTTTILGVRVIWI